MTRPENNCKIIALLFFIVAGVAYIYRVIINQTTKIMSLGKSIVRGAGNQIGRSIAKSAINKVAKGADATYVNVNKSKGRSGRTAARDFVKAAKFEFSASNRAETLENKLFNLITVFEDQITADRSYFYEDTIIAADKLNDTYEFFNFKGYSTENLDKLKSKFYNLVNETSSKIKQYHTEQLPIKQAELKKIHKKNVKFLILGFTLLPLIGWLFIKTNTDELEAAIETHKKFSKINVKLS